MFRGKKMKNKFFLIIFLCLIYLSSFGYAMTGSGSEGDPFIITDCLDLQDMKDNLTANYELGGDIDCSDTINWNSGQGFIPVGINYTLSFRFEGNFSGNGFSINDLFINTTGSYVGLFGYVRSDSFDISNFTLNNPIVYGGYKSIGSVIGLALSTRASERGEHYYSNSFVHDISVYNSSVSGCSEVGGILGAGADYVTLYNLYHEGVVNGTCGLSGSSSIGGIVGFIRHKIFNSVSHSIVYGGYRNTGGLVGNPNGRTSSSNLYSNSEIYCGSYCGGIGGDHYSSFYNVYAGGFIYSDGDVGGILGSEDVNRLHDSYSFVHFFNKTSPFIGLLADYTPLITSEVDNCFYDVNSSGLIYNSSLDYVSLNNDMKNISLYTDWNISNFSNASDTIWKIYDGYSTPFLSFETNSIHLDNPFFYEKPNSTGVNFSVSYYNWNDLINLTFYIYAPNGSMIISNYSEITGSSGVSVFYSTPFSDSGYYNWNVEVCDSSGFCDMSFFNSSFYYDISNPSVVINKPEVISYNTTEIPYNVTATDNYGLETCKYWVTRGASLEVANTTIPCSSLTGNLFVSSIGTDYVFHFFANDTSGNINTTTSNFSVSASGTVVVPAGGSGGSTVIISGDAGWTMEVAPGQSIYDKKRPLNTEKDLTIDFENIGDSSRDIELFCEDLEGDGCKFVSFDEKTFNLPLIKDTKLRETFTITIDDVRGDYRFNIIAIDDLGRTGAITVDLQVGGLGLLAVFYKIGVNSTNGVPYAVFFFPVLIGLFILFYSKVLEKVPVRSIWSMLIAFLIASGSIAFW